MLKYFVLLLTTLNFTLFAEKPAERQNYPFPIDAVHSDYRDEELVKLWGSLSDILDPALGDYRKIEKYLKYGKRPYLDAIFNQGIKMGWGFRHWKSTDPLDRTVVYATRILQGMKFVNSNGEKPFQKVIALGGVSKEDRTRCVILFSSYNYDAWDGEMLYADKMQAIVDDLENEGYKGHVLVYHGGYPMIDRGGLYLAHVPYSFKVLSLIEASLKGYQDVLWLDTSVHPTNDLSEVFKTIENTGIYLVWTGINFDYDYNLGIISDAAAKSCNLEILDLAAIPHTIAAIIGISFRNDNHHDFLREWYQLTTATLPAMSFYPEQFLLAVAAWRTQKKPSVYFWDVMKLRSLIPVKPQKADIPFWHDKS